MKARLRYIIILLCLFLGCGGMYARSKLVKTINILDTEFMEVVYAHVTNDTVLNKSKADYEILILGHNYNKYGGYGNFQLDSILREDPLLECAPTFEDFQKLSRSLGKIRESMTLCHSDSTVSFYGNIFINYYNYKEKTPEIEWLLADSETEKSWDTNAARPLPNGEDGNGPHGILIYPILSTHGNLEAFPD